MSEALAMPISPRDAEEIIGTIGLPSIDLILITRELEGVYLRKGRALSFDDVDLSQFTRPSEVQPIDAILELRALARAFEQQHGKCVFSTVIRSKESLNALADAIRRPLLGDRLELLKFAARHPSLGNDAVTWDYLLFFCT